MTQDIFTRLPLELLLMITGYLSLDIKDLCSFARSSQWLQQSLKPTVWSSAVSHRCSSTGWVIHWAAQRGRNEIIALLLNHGAELSAQDLECQTPLHVASRYGHTHTISFLFEKGAEIEAQGCSNRTSLHTAAQHRQGAAIRLLIKNGAHVNAEDAFGRTALFHAADYGDESHVRELIEAGADATKMGRFLPWVHDERNDDDSYGHKNGGVGQQQSYDETALERAARRGHDGVVRMLLGHDNFLGRVLNERSRSPLHHAARAGYTRVAKALIESGVDIDEPDDGLKTPLHLAIERDHLSTVKLLVEAGANPDRHCCYGIRLIHYAIAADNKAIVSYLLELGIDGCRGDYRGNIPADITNKPATIELLRAGGWTPKE